MNHSLHQSIEDNWDKFPYKLEYLLFKMHEKYINISDILIIVHNGVHNWQSEVMGIYHKFDSELMNHPDVIEEIKELNKSEDKKTNLSMYIPKLLNINGVIRMELENKYPVKPYIYLSLRYLSLNNEVLSLSWNEKAYEEHGLSKKLTEELNNNNKNNVKLKI